MVFSFDDHRVTAFPPISGARRSWSYMQCFFKQKGAAMHM